MPPRVASASELHSRAQAALERSYAPYSRFRVGAALLTETDRVATAANVENAVYSLSMCAERAAVFRAVAEGLGRPVAIAIAGEAETLSPCGACRQVLWEFGGPELEVTFPREGTLATVPLAELLPDAFALPGRRVDGAGPASP